MDKLRFKLYPHQVSAFVLMPDRHHISCPNGGKKYGKETPFVGGLRSPLTIPESDPVEIPFRTVGRYLKNDIAFFEIAPTSIVKRKEVSGKINSLLRNRSPPKRFKSGGICGEGVGAGLCARP